MNTGNLFMEVCIKDFGQMAPRKLMNFQITPGKSILENLFHRTHRGRLFTIICKVSIWLFEIQFWFSGYRQVTWMGKTIEVKNDSTYSQSHTHISLDVGDLDTRLTYHLRKEQTFRVANTDFPAKWRLRNENDVTGHIWLLLLIHWGKFTSRHDQSKALPRSG